MLSDVVAAIVHKMGMKLNTDDAFNQRTNIGGIGFLLRTSDAFCLLASCKWMEGESSQYNELKAIQEGVVYALKERIRLLETETDTVTLVKILNKGGITTVVSYQLCKEHFLSF